jgi:hypothetical protein
MLILVCYERTIHGADTCCEWDHAINKNKPNLKTIDEGSRIVKVFSWIDKETFNPVEKSRDHSLCIEFEKHVLPGFLHLYSTYNDFLYPRGLCRKSHDVQTYLKSTESAVTHYVLTFLTKPNQQHRTEFLLYDHHCRRLAELVPGNAKDIVNVFLKQFEIQNDAFAEAHGKENALYKFLYKFYLHCKGANESIFGARELGKRKHDDGDGANGAAGASNGSAPAGGAAEDPIVLDD